MGAVTFPTDPRGRYRGGAPESRARSSRNGSCALYFAELRKIVVTRNCLSAVNRAVKPNVELRKSYPLAFQGQNTISCGLRPLLRPQFRQYLPVIAAPAPHVKRPRQAGLSPE